MSDEAKGFRVGWVAGASAQVELYSPGTLSEEAGFQLKYTPPFRSTIRPPVKDLKLGPGELDPIHGTLSELVMGLGGRSSPSGADAPGAPPTGDGAPGEDEVLKKLRDLGEELSIYMIPQDVQSDLRTGHLFLEIGIDEKLLKYPWELMHDGDEFLCLKHAVGRYVNARQTAIPIQQRPTSLLGKSLDTLSVLVISVPRPEKRSDGTTYEYLPEAEAETEAIEEILGAADGVEHTPLVGKQATHSDVFRALKSGEYQIIHFNGHAHFDDKKAYRSGLVLQDRNMTTGQLGNTIGGKPPILCFVNACETARSVDESEAQGHLNIYGLARAFLETGAYLLGSRWKVNDRTASTFAKKFYASLVQDGEAIGNAILHARKACREQVPDDPFGWASYLYYGDPRVCFCTV